MPLAAEPLLQVRDLSVDLTSERNPARRVLSDVSFQVDAGMIVGLFGESGCGKTTLALALMNLLPPDRYRISGAVRLKNHDLLSLNERQLERIRGAEISMVFQDPLLVLNPVMRVRDQVAEVIRAHPRGTRESRHREVESAFRLVGLPVSPRISGAYPHQLSGGERQRVAIAQALASKPAVVIADEPFTALDVSRVVELTALFRTVRDQLGTSFLVISHSPGVLARTADCVLVMHEGSIVERGTPQQVFEHPSHPYTQNLLRSMPRIRRPLEGTPNGH